MTTEDEAARAEAKALKRKEKSLRKERKALRRQARDVRRQERALRSQRKALVGGTLSGVMRKVEALRESKQLADAKVWFRGAGFVEVAGGDAWVPGSPPAVPSPVADEGDPALPSAGAAARAAFRQAGFVEQPDGSWLRSPK